MNLLAIYISNYNKNELAIPILIPNFKMKKNFQNKIRLGKAMNRIRV